MLKEVILLSQEQISKWQSHDLYTDLLPSNLYSFILLHISSYAVPCRVLQQKYTYELSQKSELWPYSLTYYMI